MTPRKKQPEKLYWKDALAAMRHKAEKRHVQQRMWERLFATAQQELHDEGAVVFLGEQVELVQQEIPAQADAPSVAPPLPALLGTAAALIVSAAGYVLSYRQVASRMQ